jgi:hypothetical protein
MPIPFFLAALLGKAASSAAAKGIAGKAGANGAKGIFGGHAHHRLAHRIADRVAEKAADVGVRVTFSKKRRKADDR